MADAVLDPACLPRAPLQVERQLGEEANVESAAFHDAEPRGLEERTVVERLDCSQRLDVLLDQVGKPEEVLGSSLGAEGGPGGKRLARRLDGRVHFWATTTGHVGERALVNRRNVRERLRRPDSLTTDEVVGRDFNAGNGCRGGTHIPTRVGIGRPATRFERTLGKRTRV